MPANPFSRDPAVNVAVGADTEGFNQGIESATDKLGSLKNAAGAAGVAIGALGVGAMAKSVQAAANFEESMVEVEKVTSPETAKAMSDRIQEMAETIPMAQSELATLAADAGRFGVEGPEAIEKFTRTAAKMAEATNLSSNEAGESLAKLSELTNTPIDEMENLGSSVNSLSNNFATSSQEIVDSMLRASGSLSQLGLNQREIAGLSASLNEVSESSERAGTRLRRVGQELLDPKKAGDVANALGMTAEEFTTMRDESPVKLIRQMATVMGEGGDKADLLRETLSTTSRQALTGLSQNLDGLSEAQQRANRSFEEGESLQREFDAATDTFNARLQTFKNRLGNVAINLGEDLLPPLNDLLDIVEPAVADFQDLNKQTDGLAAKMGLAATAVAGLGGAAAIAFTGPIGLAVGAITGLTIAAGFLIDKFVDVDETISTVTDTMDTLFSDVKNSTAFKTIRESVDTAIGAIQETISTLDKTIQNQLIGPANDADSAFSKTLSSIKTEAKESLNLVQGIINDTLGVALEEAEELINSVSDTWQSSLSGENGIVANARTAFNALWNNIIKPVVDTIQAGWNTFGDDILKVASFAFGIIETTVSRAMDGVLSAINIVLDLLSGDFEGAFNTAKTFVTDTLDEIIQFAETDLAEGLSGVAGIVESAITGGFDAAKKAIIGSGGVIKTMVFDILNYFQNTGETFLSRAASSIKDTLTNGLSYLTGTGEDSLIGDIGDALSDAGETIGGGIEDAINNVLELPKEFTVGKIRNPLSGNTVVEGQTLTIPALAEGGVIEESGLAFVDEGERFSGAPGAPGAEVDQSGDMMLSGPELQDAVAEGVSQAAQEGAFDDEEIARAIEDGMGETTVEFRDQDRYRAVRR